MSVLLREWIEDGRVRIVDGAMGTVLYQRGVFLNQCYDELNISNPDLVFRVHRAYVDAGADLVETNTFGANPIKLEPYRLADRVHEINEVAARLARRAARGTAAVVGAIGPLGIRIEPWGPTSIEEAVDFFTVQIEGLSAGGVDGFMFETFSSVEELLAGMKAARMTAPDVPVFAQLTFGEEGYTKSGTTIENAAALLDEGGADVVGLNCAMGPSSMLFGVERMVAVARRPVSAIPNAGVPRDVGNRKIYLANPEYMARYAKRMVDAGAQFVGGCCGTGPEHTQAMAALLGQDERVPVVVSGSDRVQPKAGRAEGGARQMAVVQQPDAWTGPAPVGGRSRLGAQLAAGEFVRIAEVVPPAGWDVRRTLKAVGELSGAGIDAIHIADSPSNRSRMSSLHTAAIVQQETGAETICGYRCRDRLMTGMMSDLLGAAASGLRNLLLTTGNPPRKGPYDRQGVYEIDSIGLTNVVRQMNLGLDTGGNSIGEPTSFVTGVTFNPGAEDLAEEVGRFKWKSEAGADFAVSHPIFAREKLLAFMEQVGDISVPLIVGLRPFQSLEDAEFLAHEIPGAGVPHALLVRMEAAQAEGGDVTVETGLTIAREVFEAVRPYVAGVFLSGLGDHTAAARRILVE